MRKRGLVTDDEFRRLARWLSYDAVLVGSGVNSLACGALLARAGWRVCVLERNDWFGGAIHTAEITEPGFHHDVFSAWHPLWVGGAAHAQLGDDLARARARVPEHRASRPRRPSPTARRRSCSARADANAEELERHGSGDGQAWRDMLAEFFPNADLAFGVLGTELWGSAGLAFGVEGAAADSAATGSPAFTGDLLLSSRDWLERTFASERAHGLLAPWVLHTGLGPDAAASGFMTQVIAVAVQEGGMPVPRGGGARLADALVQLIRDHGGVCETGKDVERVLVQMRPRRRRARSPAARRSTAERAVIADVTPTQLYERLLAEADVPGAGARGRAPLPLRPRGDADPLRALRAGALGRGRAARPHGDRARDAGPRRRLACRERGRARPAARPRRPSSSASR